MSLSAKYVCLYSANETPSFRPIQKKAFGQGRIQLYDIIVLGVKMINELLVG